VRKVLFILGQLTDSDVDWLSTHGSRVKVAKGAELIKHGMRIDTLYIVLEGSMAVSTGRGMRIAKVSSGDILGEMSLVDSSLTAASVMAEQDSVVLALDRRTLTAKLEQDVGFAARFYRALALFLAYRMRNTIRRMGYDKGEVANDSDLSDVPESNVIDLHAADARVDRILKKLAG